MTVTMTAPVSTAPRMSADSLKTLRALLAATLVFAFTAGLWVLFQPKSADDYIALNHPVQKESVTITGTDPVTVRNSEYTPITTSNGTIAVLYGTSGWAAGTELQAYPSPLNDASNITGLPSYSIMNPYVAGLSNARWNDTFALLFVLVALIIPALAVGFVAYSIQEGTGAGEGSVEG